ncbi:ABC transporter ATP-binding protein [Candidatus Poribacteria bacterium]|nr:MAG: ABC transporter ATP-binding protein [Candidatus Poribacteria bacterium]
MVELEGVGYRIGNKWLVRNIDLKIEAGQFWIFVGPNGAGKSTLLRLISGELSPTSGQIRFLGESISDHSPEELARKRAYLQQKRDVNFPFRASEIVLLGRHPHLNGGKESPTDLAITWEAMKQVQADMFAERLYPTLSGGEASRVDLARILAQEPRLFLLDEPTNHLDPRYQVQILRLCSSIAQSGRTVIAAIHDLNIASMYAEQVLMLREGNPIAVGTPTLIFTPQRLEAVYDVPFEVVQLSSGQLVVVPLSSDFVPRTGGLRSGSTLSPSKHSSSRTTAAG